MLISLAKGRLGALAALATKKDMGLHIILVIVYLWCLCLWDWLKYRWGEPIGDRAKGERFKQYCGEVLKTVELPGAAALTVWAGLLFLLRSDKWLFVLFSDVRAYLAKLGPLEGGDPNVLANSIRCNVGCYSIGEPLWAGVVGFHMFLAAAWLILLLIKWHKEPL